MIARFRTISLNLVFAVFIANTIVFINCDDNEESIQKYSMRYLLYEVNPGEGFNLRRDVYMRMANMVKLLNEKEPWTLVLPPWIKMYHWKTKSIEQESLPWSLFFDIESLGKHIPVLEFEDYLKLMDEPMVEEAYGLQKYAEGWGGQWKEKMDFRDCIDRPPFTLDKEGKWRWYFWGYEEFYAQSFQCVSIQMEFKSLVPFLTQETKARSVLLLRAETILHGHFSNWSPMYWTARRSMRFSKALTRIGDEFRKSHLDSDDEKDKTIMEEDWRYMKRSHGDAIGGPYVAVHLRRKDFAMGYRDDVPSIKGAAQQIADVLKSQNLNTVFIATDAPKTEYDELNMYLKSDGFRAVRYEPPKEVLEKHKDGGIAIIDQWICAHSRYFIGTSVSTFSFRIQEEREILGFDQSTSYNRLCGDDPEKPCEQSTKWDILYEDIPKTKVEL